MCAIHEIHKRRKSIEPSNVFYLAYKSYTQYFISLKTTQNIDEYALAKYVFRLFFIVCIKSRA